MDPKVEPTLVDDPNAPTTECSTAEPQGIGGWLILPAIGLVVAMVETVAGVVVGLVNAGGYAENGSVLLVDLVFSAGMILWLLLAGVRFFKRKDRAPETVIAVMITYVLGQGAIMGLSRMVGVGVPDAAWGWLALSAVFTAVLVPYLLVSRRVRNAFVNP